jgi:hypothetical protein
MEYAVQEEAALESQVSSQQASIIRRWRTWLITTECFSTQHCYALC